MTIDKVLEKQINIFVDDLIKRPKSNFSDKDRWLKDWLKELCHSYALEIIGEDTERVKIVPKETFIKRLAETRYKNELRAEQRKKVKI